MPPPTLNRVKPSALGMSDPVMESLEITRNPRNSLQFPKFGDPFLCDTFSWDYFGASVSERF